MLEISNLTARYGNIIALKDVSISVPEGSITAILGANGAGKSTLLNTIIGGPAVRAAGDIRLSSQSILGRTTEEIVRAGIALVPEGRQMFAELTVDENLSMGAYLRRNREEISRDFHTVKGLFPRLAERGRQRAATLSGGEQQMVAIGRALMSRPRLLLLDEPSLGLAPLLVSEIMRLIKRINEQSVTVLLVEQNARQALNIATEAYVIETGRVVLHGPARQLLADPHVTAAYLGEG
jgi:branched-chain amino acid transport system ATP-binding protein